MNRVIPYIPEQLWKPRHLVDVPTAWDGVESILRDVMLRFKIKSNTCLEFGVDYGYSTAALANFFNQVHGVDTFQGDHHAGVREDLLKKASKALENFKNITLVPQDYKVYIDIVDKVNLNPQWDLIHIDIVHDYKPTAELGRWAVDHSDVVMFHDTIAFPEVRRAVQDIAWETGRVFYEYQVQHGVGFLVKE